MILVIKLCDGERLGSVKIVSKIGKHLTTQNITTTIPALHKYVMLEGA